MNELLTARYQTLFRNYGIGGNGLVLRAKHLIVDRMEREPNFLRADAAHFLLINLDHMVIRPCSGYMPDPLIALPRPMNLTIPYAEMPNLIEKYLETIFDYLGANEDKPVSAHGLTRAILQTWPQLGNLFSWS
jgi:hypothetical protein